MTPLVDLPSVAAVLPFLLLVPASVLGLVLFRVVMIMRADAKAEAFHERCQRIDVYARLQQPQPRLQQQAPAAPSRGDAAQVAGDRVQVRVHG